MVSQTKTGPYYEYAHARSKSFFVRPLETIVFAAVTANAGKPHAAGSLAEDFTLCEGSLAIEAQDT
jgi:hypothetical protein